jgi:hypothetical protein
MFTNKLDGDRLFARIYELDLECAQCGEVFYLNSVGRSSLQVPGRRKRWDPGPYNFRTGRFTCPSCKTTFGLGGYVFPIRDADGQLSRHGEEPPVDWVPTYKQGVALREQTGGRIDGEPRRWIDAKNSVVRPGCTCQIRGMSTLTVQMKPAKKPYKTRLIINPACAVHGSLAETVDERAGTAKSVPAGTEIVTVREEGRAVTSQRDAAPSSTPPTRRGRNPTSPD